MASLISYDYGCDVCHAVDVELVPRDAIPESITCATPDCGGTRTRRIGCANITKASWPDGFRRNNQIREQQKLRKEMSKAMRSQNLKEAKRVGQEQSKLAATVKTSKVEGGV